ncbi:MAG: hypothetical protein QNJ17_07645 [Desulfocapsaceae bacterium]|nr:hypothetical protein [Desulfocapsaceae bacterium]
MANALVSFKKQYLLSTGPNAIYNKRQFCSFHATVESRCPVQLVDQNLEPLIATEKDIVWPEKIISLDQCFQSGIHLARAKSGIFRFL